MTLHAQAPAPSRAAQPPAANQPAAAATIEPDRPDLTNGAHLVDRGMLQLEAGVLHARSGSINRSTGTPIGLRIGILARLEARISSDGFLYQTSRGVSVHGAGNVQIGAKLRVIDGGDGEPILSLLPSINLPVASAANGLGSGDADVTLDLLTGADLGRASHVDVNYGIGEIGGGGQARFTQHLISVSVSHNVTDKLSPYVEAYWFSKLQPDGDQILALDWGFIHALSPRLVVDGGVGVGLTSNTPDFSVFAGMSMAIDHVFGHRTAAKHLSMRWQE
jgi:hypothetical protein